MYTNKGKGWLGELNNPSHNFPAVLLQRCNEDIYIGILSFLVISLLGEIISIFWSSVGQFST